MDSSFPSPRRSSLPTVRWRARRARSGASTVRSITTNASPTTSRSGKRTSFPRSVKLKPDEVVVFSYIVYKSRRDRDRINKAVMADPRLKSMMDPKKMPFDGKRMFWGGFKSLVRV